MGSLLSDKVRSSLKTYELLLEKWQRTLNLVSPSTLPFLWERHFEDSLQLLPYLPEAPSTLLDLGSGAGFPGLVLAISREHTLQVTLLEADLRKCIFLENVSRETKGAVKVVRSRIEDYKGEKTDVVTARALAPLEKLLAYSEPFLGPESFCLFLKGKDWEQEVKNAEKKWKFSLEILPSLTDSKGRILKIKNLKRISSP